MKLNSYSKVQIGVDYYPEHWDESMWETDIKLMKYEDDFFAGAPAVTVNWFGAGRVYYIGTHAEESYWMKLLGDIAPDAGLTLFPELPDGVQAFTRTGSKGELLFLLNLSRTSQTVGLDKLYRSALTGTPISGPVELAAYGVEILENHG
ncbi:Beta-galactosidase C-terminal domain [Paenibacillus sp. FSL R10-2736]|uniref:Beta-galactosidase C-terminal domain n=1 Tax=Paenibacillus sp. FSL R10-2736 TaxID=2954692 RepID=UPI0030F9FC54